MQQSLAKQPFTTLSGCVYSAHGIYMIVAGGVLGLLSWLIPSLLVKVIKSDVIDPASVTAAARGIIEHRGLMPLLGLPPIVFGVLLVNRVRLRFLWVMLGLLSMLLPGALMIYVFVSTIGLLYQSHDALT